MLSLAKVALLWRFKVFRRRMGTGDRKTLHAVRGGVRQTEWDGRGGTAAEQAGHGERSSLGNLFWSSQSADTQGAGKPITV